MKCDELKYERLGDANKTYPASTLVIRKQFVDEAIAEFNDALKIKDDLLIENGHEIGALKAENEKMNEENKKLVFALSEAVQKQGFRNLNIHESLVKSMEKIAEVRGENQKYIEQLRGEVGKWHHAYDALVIERNALVRKILETEKSVSVKDHANGYECVMILRDAYNALSDELEELRKHEVEWETAKAQNRVYEERIAELEEIDNTRLKQLNELYQLKEKNQWK